MIANGMVPATGIWELDSIIYTAAVVTALAVIWRKVLRPMVHAAKRVNVLLDLSDNLPPTVQQTLLALPGQIQAIHDRIDDHMLREEANLGSVTADIAAVKQALDARAPMFDELKTTMQASQSVISQHIAADDARFDAAAVALVKGQEVLNAQLENIKQSLPKGTA